MVRDVVLERECGPVFDGTLRLPIVNADECSGVIDVKLTMAFFHTDGGDSVFQKDIHCLMTTCIILRDMRSRCLSPVIVIGNLGFDGPALAVRLMGMPGPAPKIVFFKDKLAFLVVGEGLRHVRWLPGFGRPSKKKAFIAEEFGDGYERFGKDLVSFFQYDLSFGNSLSHEFSFNYRFYYSVVVAEDNLPALKLPIAFIDAGIVTVFGGNVAELLHKRIVIKCSGVIPFEAKLLEMCELLFRNRNSHLEELVCESVNDIEEDYVFVVVGIHVSGVKISSGINIGKKREQYTSLH